MAFKSIVNNDLVNLQNCEDEPIHIPGQIQPHGFLLAADIHTWKINFCSENVSQFITVTYVQLLGKQLSDIFDAYVTMAITSSQGKTGQLEAIIRNKVFF